MGMTKSKKKYIPDDILVARILVEIQLCELKKKKDHLDNILALFLKPDEIKRLG
jgi:hypothetical protein